MVHTGFADCVGTMIAGSIEDPPKLLEKALSPPAGDASLYLVGRRVPAPEAAWINGAAAHALDYDDVALRGHPSAVLVPAILAEARVAQGHRRADGDGLRRRATRCGPTCSAATRDQHHEKGWHPTGIFGAIGAAAACASLRGLDPEKATQAIALGASQSAGLVSNFGTMTKPFHAGQVGARRHHRGAPRRRRLHVLARRAGAPAGLPRRRLAQGQRRPHLADAGGARLEHPDPGPQREEVSAVLLHAPGHRRRARHAGRQEGRPRRHQGRSPSRPAAATPRCCATAGRRPGSRPSSACSSPWRAPLPPAASASPSSPTSSCRGRRSRRCSPRSRWCPTTARTRSGWVPRPTTTVVIDTNDGRRLESARVTLERGSPELPLSPEELWVKFEACFAIGNPRLESRARSSTP